MEDDQLFHGSDTASIHRDFVEKLLFQLMKFPGVATRTRMEAGNAAERICEVAQEERAETIVLGNRGTHGSRWAVRDSVPNLVLRHAPCSVYIVDTRKAQ